MVLASASADCLPADMTRASFPADVYDLRGLNCPMPVLRTKKRLSAMQTGERLVIATTDPLAVIDIPAFCNDDGHTLIEAVADARGHIFIIEKN